MKARIVKKEYLNEELLVPFYKYLNEKEIEIVDKIEAADIMITLGGDGTILSAAQEILEKDIPILAINMGSLGYLADVKLEESFSMLDNILLGKYSVEKRHFLEVKKNDEIFYALNELVIAKGGLKSKLINVEVYSNERFINKYRADGIIVSTPTGSTAYSLSAGGPIIHPELSALSITPLSPQSLTARPIIVGGDAKLSFKISSRDDDVHMDIDGKMNYKIEEKDVIEATLSTKTLTLIKPENRDYFMILREKLKWGDSI